MFNVLCHLVTRGSSSSLRIDCGRFKAVQKLVFLQKKNTNFLGIFAPLKPPKYQKVFFAFPILVSELAAAAEKLNQDPSTSINTHQHVTKKLTRRPRVAKCGHFPARNQNQSRIVNPFVNASSTPRQRLINSG